MARLTTNACGGGGGAALVLLLLARTIHAQSQPDVCLRWAQAGTLGISPDGSNSSSISTLYLAGGDARLLAGQTQNTRTNALLALDLSQNFSIAAPPLTLVQPDTGNAYEPSRTSLGAAFSNAAGDEIYYYGGYFEEFPERVVPDEQKLFRYSIPNRQWSTVQTTGATVERVAEGAAGVAPPQAGETQPTFYYFGGHLDGYTTEDWSLQTERVYLSSLIEYDAGPSSWTNHSTYAASSSVTANSTFEAAPLLRADSTLTFIPGLGTDGKGLMVSIGGGNANQMLDNSILDVYDIGADGWSKQATQGRTIGPRVGHCAVRGSANVNGVLQHQIFVYGGQASNRTTQIQNGQNSDLYILSIPSFTWTFVGGDLPSQPTGRAAHTCTLMGSQMVVVGGFVSEDLICEQPGVYVLDTTELEWRTQYTAGTTYTTPDHPEILAVTGGRGTGSSTSGSGYAIGTGADDADTSSTFRPSGGDRAENDGESGSNTGAIAGGVVGGILGLALLAGLILFLLRRKRKRAAAEREASGEAKEKARLAGYAGSSNGGSPGSGPLGNPYDSVAPDDVEEQTAGFNAQFSHLVPRQTLRVVNA